MSYCRFSTNDFACQLYVYASTEGYSIHVAANKPVGDIPKITSDYLDTRTPTSTAEEYVVQHKAQLDWLKDCKREKITLKYAGESFYLPQEQTVAKLKELKELGYVFPDYVISDIEDEAACLDGERIP